MLEKEIIQKCQQGDLNYFGELYELYVEQIYKFIYLKTYDVELSEDLTSQTFFQAMDKIKSFKNDDGANFKAWLYRIAYNLVINNYRAKKEDISLEEVLEFGEENTFAQDLDNKEKLKKVFAYFDTLNPKHKQILVMRLWDDLSFKEISHITGESLDNCKKIVSRSLSKIPADIMIFLFAILLIF